MCIRDSDKEELILAGKLLGRGHAKVFAEFLDSMDTEPREVVFQILEDINLLEERNNG